MLFWMTQWKLYDYDADVRLGKIKNQILNRKLEVFELTGKIFRYKRKMHYISSQPTAFYVTLIGKKLT